MSSKKQEVYEHRNGDLRDNIERNGSGASTLSGAEQVDPLDKKLSASGEYNLFYDHDLTRTVKKRSGSSGYLISKSSLGSVSCEVSAMLIFLIPCC